MLGLDEAVALALDGAVALSLAGHALSILALPGVPAIHVSRTPPRVDEVELIFEPLPPEPALAAVALPPVTAPSSDRSAIPSLTIFASCADSTFHLSGRIPSCCSVTVRRRSRLGDQEFERGNCGCPVRDRSSMEIVGVRSGIGFPVRADPQVR